MSAVRSIAVLGAGVAAWCAAAAFARRLRVAVTVVEDPAAAPQLADLFGAAPPSAVVFHRDIGLDEAALVGGCDALFRLGTRFEGWAGDGAYIHAYGDHGQPIGSASFHQHWLRGEAGPFGAYSAAVMLATAGRFAHPTAEDGPAGAYGYGLALDPARYRDAMRAHARRLGAAVVPGRVAGAEREDERVIAVRLEDGGRVAADLFVDAADALPTEGWQGWAHWLPCDEAVIAAAPPMADPPPHDWAVAEPDGWRLVSPTRSRVLHAHLHPRVARSDRITAMRDAGHRVTFRPGRRIAPWVGNTVAIGDGAVCVEPLEAVSPHLVHAQIDRIVAALPGRDMHFAEVADYNRQAAAEADRIRDFLILHYAVADRPEPFWRAARETPPPDSLAADLALFAERGRLRIHDGETFARDSWLAVLIGQGVRPRRRDPLAEATPVERLPAMLRDMRAAVAAAVARAPGHGAYLARMLAGA